MATATNLTVKKNDGTTDIVWTLLAASGGDRSPAWWRSETASGYAGQRPTLSVASRDNGDKTARRTDITFVYPAVYTDTATSTTKLLGKAVITVSAVLPLGIDSTSMNEAAAQFAHLLNTTLIVGSLQSGFAPT
jgi:hypothetical protein